jgi:hypothetical protein
MRLGATPRLAVQPLAATPDDLIRLTNLIVVNSGIEMSTQRVTRLVRNYRYSGVRGRGFEYFDYLCVQLQLRVEERHRLLADPEIAKALTYCDPVGEEATDRVMKQRKRSIPRKGPK